MRRAVMVRLPVSLVAAALVVPALMVPGLGMAAGELPSDAGTPLPFAEALRAVTARTLEVGQAEGDLRIATARREEAEAAYLPSVAANGRLDRFWPVTGGASTQQSADVTATVNLYRFGGDKARADAARATEEGAAAERGSTTQRAERAAADALLAIIGVEMELAIERELLRTQQSNLDMARKLYTRGLRPAQDVEKVEIDAANEEARLRDAELRLIEARGALRTITGTSVAVEAKWPWLARFKEADAAAVMAAAGAAAAARPDREALAAKVRALDAEIAAAEARYYPSLDAGVSYGIQGRPEIEVFERTVSGNLVLTVPLFDRFSARTDRREKELLRARAVADLEAKDRALAAESDAARAGFTSALATARIREKTLGTVRSLYEHSLKSFQSGVLSANELTVDRSRLHETELSTVQGWAAVHRYYARLCQSAGKSIATCG